MSVSELSIRLFEGRSISSAHTRLLRLDRWLGVVAVFFGFLAMILFVTLSAITLIWYLSYEVLWIGLIILLPLIAGCSLGWLFKKAAGDMLDKVHQMDARIKAEQVSLRDARQEDIGQWRGLVVGNLRVPSDGER
jgi:hypothetical protein